MKSGTEAFRWMGFVTAIWLQEVLDIDQVPLNNIAVASDLGKAMGCLSGLASLYLPMWTVLLIADCLGLWAMVSNGSRWSGRSLPWHTGSWFNTVRYLICIRNFANERGFALGLSTSYVGLSAAVYTSIQTAIAPHTESLFLLLNVGVPTMVCFLSVLFVVGANQKEMAQMQRPFLVAISYGIAIVTGMYMLVLDFVSLSSSSGELHALIFLCVLLAPVSLPATLFIMDMRNQPQ